MLLSLVSTAITTTTTTTLETRTATALLCTVLRCGIATRPAYCITSTLHSTLYHLCAVLVLILLKAQPAIPYTTQSHTVTTLRVH